MIEDKMAATQIETPMQEIMRYLAVDSEEQALERVREIAEQLAYTQAALMSLTVIPVVMVNGQPLFVQFPPTQAAHKYAPELIETVRDALVEASTSLRTPLARSRAERVAPKETPASA